MNEKVIHGLCALLAKREEGAAAGAPGRRHRQWQRWREGAATGQCERAAVG
jgi:hypothetical protein